MKSEQITCERALYLLLGEGDALERDDLLQARLHAARCPQCSSVYNPGMDNVPAPALVRGSRAIASLRVGLLVIALTQLVFAIPWLVGRSVFPDSHVAVSHLTRDGALGLVIAALGIVTVWRPRYVHSTMILALIVFAIQVGAGLFDQRESTVSPAFEIVHLMLVVIVFGLFALAADIARHATPRAEPHSRILR